ncbi:MAG: HNH endonuclease [Verrucomicrobiota bacterium]
MSAKSKRAPIPASTKHLLNEQCGTACAICRETKTSMLEIHHIDGDVRNPELGNLLILCASCHAEFSRGTKSEADAKMFKRMAETGHLLPRRDSRPPSADVVNHGPNHGVMAQQVYVEKYVTAVNGESGPQIRPGTIGANVVEHNYIEYLVKQLAKFRTAGGSYGQKRTGTIHPGVVRNQICNEFGALPKDLPLRGYGELCDHLRGKIDNTVLGRNNQKKGIRNYHSEEDHLVRKNVRKKPRA